MTGFGDFGSTSAATTDPQALMIQRRRRMAELLTAGSLKPDDNMRSPVSVYSKLAQALAGAVGTIYADKDATKLSDNQRAEAGEFSAGLSAMRSGGASPAAAALAPPEATPISAPAAGTAPVPQVQRTPLAPPNIQPIIERAAAETGIPVPILTAVLQQESGMGQDPGATANGGGPMQIIRSTAANPGYGLQPLPEADRLNPERSIPWGAQYLAARGRAAGVTDWNDPAQRAKGLAAYNGGGDPNYVRNVSRFIPDGATPAAAPQPAPAAAPPQAPAGAAPGRMSPEYLAQIERGLRSSNPQVQRAAQAALQTAQLQRTTEREPMERVRMPDGSERMVPRSQAAGMVSAPPPREQIPGRDIPLSPEVQAQREGQARAGAPTVAVNNERSFGGQVGDLAAKRLDTLREAATSGEEAIRVAGRVRQILDAGAITGTLADNRLGIERALSTIGLIDGDRVANTEQLTSEMARSVIPLISALKGPTSDRDIEFLKQVQAGSITFSAQTMRRMAAIADEYGRRALKEYNDIAQAVQDDPNTAGVPRSIYRPRAEPGPPAEISPEQRQRAGIPPPPAANEIRNGYRYKGGPPGDPASWERVQ